MFKEDTDCVKKLLNPVKRILTQENIIKREPVAQRISRWNEVHENYDKYLDRECGEFLGDLDKCFHGDFNAALLILAISFTDNGESFAPAEKFSDNEREAFKTITQYNVFESRTSGGIREKLELQNDEILARWYDDYQDMKKWVDTTLKDRGMNEHVRYYLNNKWSEICRNIDKALNYRWIHRIMKIKEEQKIRDKEPEKQQDTKQLLSRLQDRAKKLTRYEPLTTGFFTEAQGQIADGRNDDARKILTRVEPVIDDLLECESLLATWKAKGYILTELEGLLPRKADEVHPAFQKIEQNINRLESITQELEIKKRSYPNLREMPETASIILSIEQNLKNPARIDTVEKDNQQLNNAIHQLEITEKNIRDQLEKILREVGSSEIKQEIDRIEKSIQQHGITYAKEMLRNLAEKQLSTLIAVLSKFRPDGAAVSISSDAIRKQIIAQNYGDAIIDSEKVIVVLISIETNRFVRVADAKQYEMTFIGRTGLKIGKTGDHIKIQGKTFIVEGISEYKGSIQDKYIPQVNRPLKVFEIKNLPENRYLIIKLLEKKLFGTKQRYTFQASFLSRLSNYAEFGFDTEPLSLQDLNTVLVDACDAAKQTGEPVFLCIASPTGFVPELHAFIDSKDFHKNFLSRYLSVCFLDLETAKLIVNPADEVAKSFLPYCEMVSDREKMKTVREVISQNLDEQFMQKNYAEYSLALKSCPDDGLREEDLIKIAFNKYRDEKGYRTGPLDDGSLVMWR